MFYNPVLLNLDPDLDPNLPVCGIQDEILGATCTRSEHKDLQHCDDSDWRFIRKWRLYPDLSLIVVGKDDG